MSDGGARISILAPPSRLSAYVAVVATTGAAGLVAAVLGTDWTNPIDHALVWAIALLTVAALVGEVKPLDVSRIDENVETVSVSTPFILALVSVGGVGFAVVAQAIASLADDVLHHRSFQKSAFNTAQYTLSVFAARFVFCQLADLPFFGGPVSVDVSRLGPLLAAGVAMIGVNRLLVAVVVAIATSRPIANILREDGTFFMGVQVVLVCLGGVGAHVAESGLPFLVLLCAPAVAVYLTTAAAIRHAHQASHDALTGVGNRGMLNAQLRSALADASGAPASGPSLVLLDLDHFKDINDTLGHPVGDELLRKVAERLSAALGDEARVNRLGGDEFAVVIDGGLAEGQALARRLLDALEAPMRLEELELLVRASAGVAVAPEHGTDATTLMKNADIALYRAKLDRDRTTTYSPEFDVNTLERLQLLGDLRVALDTGQLGVVYQPQVDLMDLRTVGVEALVRWNHPTRGLVAPDEFVPLAENSGLIAELTAYVLDTALATLAQCRVDGHDVRMAVNLSARHLSDLALPRQVGDALRRHDIPAASLVLEVTETGILSDPARVDTVIGALRRLGVGIAVDDYGTGHASLSYLKRLEVDELKIDRSFVSDVGRDSQDFILVRSTIALAHDLGLRVIAEGIEDESTAMVLRELGCYIGQGFHLGRPTSAEKFLDRLRDERVLPESAQNVGS